MRDPFADYDAWLEAPYQRMYEEAEQAEWIAENSTYETDCCGVQIQYDNIRFDKDEMTPLSQTCPKCGVVAGIDVTLPRHYDDYDEYLVDYNY